MTVYPNDMLSPTFLMGAIQERPERAAIKMNYIGETLFPKRDVAERRLMWDSMVSENNLAGFYSLKGAAVPGSDLMFATHFADLVDLKASRYLDAEIVNAIRDPGMQAIIKNAGDSFIAKGISERISRHVRENLAWCDDAVDAQMEYLALQAITGTVTWPPVNASGATITDAMPHWNADLTLSIDMGLTAAFSQDASTLSGYKSRAGGGYAWTNASADPVKDLEVIAEYMVEQTGIDPYGAKILMSRSTLSRISFLPNVLRYLNGFTPIGGSGGSAANYAEAGPQYADVSTVKNFLQTKLGYEIVTYDAQWTYRTLSTTTGVETVNRVKFLPEGKLVILPKGFDVGFMAQAPHEVNAGVWTTGKSPWIWTSDKPPIQREMGINTVAFPIITNPAEIFNLNCYA